MRSQVRKEKEALNLATTEANTIEQEIKRLQNGLHQFSKNSEALKVSCYKNGK